MRWVHGCEDFGCLESDTGVGSSNQYSLTREIDVWIGWKDLSLGAYKVGHGEAHDSVVVLVLVTIGDEKDIGEKYVQSSSALRRCCSEALERSLAKSYTDRRYKP
jgi:hypothetical protein